MTPPDIQQLSPEAKKARDRRSLIMVLALLAFVVLVFLITVSKLGENASAISQNRGFEEALSGQSAPLPDEPPREGEP